MSVAKIEITDFSIDIFNLSVCSSVAVACTVSYIDNAASEAFRHFIACKTYGNYTMRIATLSICSRNHTALTQCNRAVTGNNARTLTNRRRIIRSYFCPLTNSYAVYSAIIYFSIVTDGYAVSRKRRIRIPIPGTASNGTAVTDSYAAVCRLARYNAGVIKLPCCHGVCRVGIKLAVCYAGNFLVLHVQAVCRRMACIIDMEARIVIDSADP